MTQKSIKQYIKSRSKKVAEASKKNLRDTLYTRDQVVDLIEATVQGCVTGALKKFQILKGK